MSVVSSAGRGWAGCISCQVWVMSVTKFSTTTPPCSLGGDTSPENVYIMCTVTCCLRAALPPPSSPSALAAANVLERGAHPPLNSAPFPGALRHLVEIHGIDQGRRGLVRPAKFSNPQWQGFHPSLHPSINPQGLHYARVLRKAEVGSVPLRNLGSGSGPPIC